MNYQLLMVKIMKNLDFLRSYKNQYAEGVEISQTDWNMISQYNLPEWFMEENADKLDMRLISINGILSNEFIEKFADELCWNNLAIHQDLSEDLIIKYIKGNQIHSVKFNKNLSEKVCKHFNIENCTLTSIFHAGPRNSAITIQISSPTKISVGRLHDTPENVKSKLYDANRNNKNYYDFICGKIDECVLQAKNIMETKV